MVDFAYVLWNRRPSQSVALVTVTIKKGLTFNTNFSDMEGDEMKKLKQYTKYKNISEIVDFKTILALAQFLAPAYSPKRK